MPKLFDLSQGLSSSTSFWPYYPPFEWKYFKRKCEHGVNAQIIHTSNHIGTHVDAPFHFVTSGLTIDKLPLEWMYGPGVIVDLSDIMSDLDVYTPKMITDRVEVKDGDILILHTGWHRFQIGESDQPDEERYIHMHPGAHPDMCQFLLDKKIKLWGMDCVSTDHPMNLPIGRFLGKGTFGQCEKVRKLAESKFGGPEGVAKLFPEEHYQLTHNALFKNNCFHVENLGGQIGAPELQNKRCTISSVPWKFVDGEAAFCRAMAILDD